jgi:hypothetical protein
MPKKCILELVFVDGSGDGCNVEIPALHVLVKQFN